MCVIIYIYKNNTNFIKTIENSYNSFVYIDVITKKIAMKLIILITRKFATR